MTAPRDQDLEFMEVDYYQDSNGFLPNLECMKPAPSPSQQNPWPMDTPKSAVYLVKPEMACPSMFEPVLSDSQKKQPLRQISFFRQQSSSSCTDTPIALLPERLSGSRQTNQPLYPGAAEAGEPASDDPTPGLEGFDDLPEIPVHIVDECLEQCESSAGGAPTMPDIHDTGSGNRIQSVILIPKMLQHRPSTSSYGIVLRNEPEIGIDSSPACKFASASGATAASTIECSPSTGAIDPEDSSIYHELMDASECDGVIEGDGQCARHEADMQFSVTVGPRSIAESRVLAATAKYVTSLHVHLTRDFPQTKKKPMLHEYLSYILFLGDRDRDLSPLRDSVHFCDCNGNRQVGRLHGEYFRVSKFADIAEVWRLIKCNSSMDCMKNMKRAMR